MAKSPSEKTQLTAARRVLRELERERNTLRIERDTYRARATKAEQELAEWKGRFDELLKLRVDVSASDVRHD